MFHSIFLLVVEFGRGEKLPRQKKLVDNGCSNFDNNNSGAFFRVKISAQNGAADKLKKMKNKILEIRWHGRGGQGAKTASLLFADAAMALGKYIQAFPEYGPERMGAPVASFNRLSDEPITLHCGITNPSIVLVLDPTLIDSVDVTAGLPEDGTLIINTSLSPQEIREKLNFKQGKVGTVNASLISKETIGREIPNTPMLGALVKVSQFLTIEEIIGDLEKKLKKKFAHKPEVIAGNLAAVKRAFEEVVLG